MVSHVVTFERVQCAPSEVKVAKKMSALTKKIIGCPVHEAPMLFRQNLA
jgi:hypothetical protein